MGQHLDILYPQHKYRDLHELLLNAVARFHDADAYIVKHGSLREPSYERITYARFDSEVAALATSLTGRGYKDGCPIAVLGKNSYPWALSYFSATAGGNTIVPLDKALPVNEAGSLLIRSGAKVLFFDRENEDMIRELRDGGTTEVELWVSMEPCEGFISMEQLIHEGSHMISRGDDRYDNLEIEPSSLAVILFTSGTTSKSKAVMLSHTNLCENVYAFTSCVKLEPGDVNLAFLPYHHTYGAMAGLISMLACGTTSAFCDGLKHLRNNLVEYHASIFMSVPLLIEALYKKAAARLTRSGISDTMKDMLQQPLEAYSTEERRQAFSEAIDMLGGKLRLIMSGASPADPGATDALNKMGILTTQIYGLSETSPGVAIETAAAIRAGSVGKALPNVDIKIIDPDEKGVGEIAVKGPNVMLGYFADPAATAAVIKDGWFYSGDLGRIDEDGYLFLAGRRKNVIVMKNGKNIYPEELETLINNLPYVQESMVFTARKKGRNTGDQVLCCKLVYNADYVRDFFPGEDIAKIADRDIDKINESMPAYKHIKKLIVTDEPMAKTSTSKIKRFIETDKILKKAADF
ncbi:MAG: AMP-binding protein [Anaerovoracaceae bacterium]|jgi:long-chain acyl-CoA synthetase